MSTYCFMHNTWVALFYYSSKSKQHKPLTWFLGHHTCWALMNHPEKKMQSWDTSLASLVYTLQPFPVPLVPSRHPTTVSAHRCLHLSPSSPFQALLAAVLISETARHSCLPWQKYITNQKKWVINIGASHAEFSAVHQILECKNRRWPSDRLKGCQLILASLYQSFTHKKT